MNVSLESGSKQMTEYLHMGEILNFGNKISLRREKNLFPDITEKEYTNKIMSYRKQRFNFLMLITYHNSTALIKANIRFLVYENSRKYINFRCNITTKSELIM